MPWNYAVSGNGEPAGCRVIFKQLELDRFWTERLLDSRRQLRHILQPLVCYRLIEWRLYRQWFDGRT
jgi:hypothetical protein